MANKRKTTTAIVAGVTALAIALGGTFAWTSISQQARNEAVVDINPGGRLHDDFNGTNKDVYVENFGDELTGVPIYARIRLDQYMEIGQQAGLKKTTDKKATPIISTDTIDDTDNWETYIPGEDAVINSANPFFKYWKWDLGNDEGDMPIYMPTFNKNKDSLDADINGTYEGTVDGDKVHYDNYKMYTADEKLTADATYDFDDNTIEEEKPTIRANENDPWDSANIYKESEEHTATKISSTADVILMSEWMKKTEDERKAFVGWVYDTDGWAYWSQAIQPGKTTGLLLSGIEQIRVPDDSWYYGINVVGQFATAGDLSAFTMNGETMTDEALELLSSISGTETFEIEGPKVVSAGDSYSYSFTRYVAGIESTNQPATAQDVTWNVSAIAPNKQEVEGFSITGGDLTVPDGVEDGTIVTITVTYKDKIYTYEVEIIELVLSLYDSNDEALKTYVYDNALITYIPYTENDILTIKSNVAITNFDALSGGEKDTIDDLLYHLSEDGIKQVDDKTLQLTFNGNSSSFSSWTPTVRNELGITELGIEFKIETDLGTVPVRLFKVREYFPNATQGYLRYTSESETQTITLSEITKENPLRVYDGVSFILDNGLSSGGMRYYLSASTLLNSDMTACADSKFTATREYYFADTPGNWFTSACDMVIIGAGEMDENEEYFGWIRMREQGLYYDLPVLITAPPADTGETGE